MAVGLTTAETAQKTSCSQTEGETTPKSRTYRADQTP